MCEVTEQYIDIVAFSASSKNAYKKLLSNEINKWINNFKQHICP